VKPMSCLANCLRQSILALEADMLLCQKLLLSLIQLRPNPLAINRYYRSTQKIGSGYVPHQPVVPAVLDPAHFNMIFFKVFRDPP
jgi:hypothetical protein